MSYKQIETNVILVNGKKVKFKHPIVEVVCANDIYMVRLDMPPNKKGNQNVFGVSSKGKIIWQISEVESVYENNPYVGMNVTVSMQKIGGKFVKLHKWDGVTYEIRPETGVILSSRFTK